MKQLHVGMAVLLILLCAGLFTQAQQTVATNTNVVVPPLVNFSGVLTDVNGKPLTGTVGVTFYLYQEQQGGTPLWIETQNVQPDKYGHYTVQLGASSSQGLPADLFSSGEARWLGVQAQGQAEQPRVMLLSVPYALKAGDAQTVGGLPASAFVLAAPGAGNGTGSAPSGSGSNSNAPNIGGSGTEDYIPLWIDSSGDLGNSAMFQSGSSPTAEIGINTTTPAATLDVNGGVIARGPLQLPSTGTATPTQGYDSQPLQLQGSAYNGSAAIGPMFQLQTEPSGNNTSGAAGTLNLLYGNGSGQPKETGLNIASNGIITFNSSQTFPNTVSSITAGTGITIGGTKTNPTVGINTTFANEYYPQLNAANTFTKSQTVNGTMTATTFSGNGSGLTNVNASQLGGLSSSAFAQLGAASNTFTGSLTASSFTGNGTGLTNVNAALLNGLSSSAFQPAGSYATLGSNNFTGNQGVTGSVTVTGTVSGGELTSGDVVNATNGFNLGGIPFAFGSYANASALLGFAGNSTMTCCNNTAIGFQALYSDVGDSAYDGSFNTAVGTQALYANNNTSGQGVFAKTNTAVGYQALYANTSGGSNTAVGTQALFTNNTGSYNTAIGVGAGYTVDQSNLTGYNNTFLGTSSALSTGSLTNATAIGFNAEVAESNAMVLGEINGVNAATASTFVGIGTTTPHAALDVAGNNIQTLIGDPGCGSGLAGIGFVVSGGFNSCNNFALIGKNTGDLYINSVESGATHFRNNNGSDLMTIAPGGNVGIGTTAPDTLLSVNGGADKPGGGSWGTFSDRRLKTLDGNFSSGLSQILKINPVRYRYKEENALGITDHQEHVGLVAQEVQKVIPEAVTENNKGYLLVNNDPIIWAMLNAIKEQQAQIKEQRAQVKQQQAQIVALRAQLRKRAAKDTLLEARLAQLEKRHDRLSASNSLVATASPRPGTP